MLSLDTRTIDSEGVSWLFSPRGSRKLVESFNKRMNPELPHFSTWNWFYMQIANAVKAWSEEKLLVHYLRVLLNDIYEWIAWDYALTWLEGVLMRSRNEKLGRSFSLLSLKPKLILYFNLA